MPASRWRTATRPGRAWPGICTVRLTTRRSFCRRPGPAPQRPKRRKSVRQRMKRIRWSVWPRLSPQPGPLPGALPQPVRCLPQRCLYRRRTHLPRGRDRPPGQRRIPEAQARRPPQRVLREAAPETPCPQVREQPQICPALPALRRSRRHPPTARTRPPAREKQDPDPAPQKAAPAGRPEHPSEVRPRRTRMRLRRRRPARKPVPVTAGQRPSRRISRLPWQRRSRRVRRRMRARLRPAAPDSSGRRLWLSPP